MPAERSTIEKRIDEIQESFAEALIEVKHTVEEIRRSMLGSLDGKEEGLVYRMRQLEAQNALLLARISKLESDNADTEKKKWLLGLTLSGVAVILWKLVDWLMSWATKK